MAAGRVGRYLRCALVGLSEEVLCSLLAYRIAYLIVLFSSPPQHNPINTLHGLSFPHVTSAILMASVADGRCAFIVPKKNRQCPMQARAGQAYCAEHLAAAGATAAAAAAASARAPEPRVQCPYGNHTVPASQLHRHIPKCSDYKLLQKQRADPAHVPGINAGPGPPAALPDAPPELADRKGRVNTSTMRRLALAVHLGPTAFSALLARIEAAAATVEASSGPTRRSVLFPDSAVAAAATAGAADTTGHRPSHPKHCAQQASIVGNMEAAGLMERPKDTTFIEFGAGKGYLTAMLADCWPDAGRLVMMDVRGFKLVADRGLRDREMARVRCDAADFEPTGALGPTPRPLWVAHGKHLCGAATDLTLRCVLRHLKTNKEEDKAMPRVMGLAVATCCHHRCCWEHYVGQDVLAEMGFTPEEFELMSYMAGWALCGHGAPGEDGDGEGDGEGAGDSYNEVEDKTDEGEDEERTGKDGDWRPHFTLSRRARMAAGRHCKRLIDWGRLEALQRGGFAAEDVIYCDPEVSGENRLILATAPPPA
jgi:tRNA:m4X modification enzyme